MNTREIVLTDYDNERLKKLIQQYKSGNKKDQDILKPENAFRRLQPVSCLLPAEQYLAQ